MPLQLKIVSEHADIVGDDAVREFREEGGTIGRSLRNDWILPDPDRASTNRTLRTRDPGPNYVSYSASQALVSLQNLHCMPD